MPAVLTAPRPGVTRRPAPPVVSAGIDPVQALCLLGGCGLLAYALRGSRPDFASALLGGLLLYQGLSRPNRDPRENEFSGYVWTEPPDAGPRPVPPVPVAPAVQAEKVVEARPEQAVDGETAPTASGLTPEEHACAEVRAYFLALERGNGWVPSYEPERAAEDFRRAAGEVLAGR